VSRLGGAKPLPHDPVEVHELLRAQQVVDLGLAGPVAGHEGLQTTLLISGTIPNRKGQRLLVHWLAASFSAGRLSGLDDLTAWLERTRLGSTPLAYTGRAEDLGPLQRLLPAAVEAVRQ